jgi:hypothetical protein
VPSSSPAIPASHRSPVSDVFRTHPWVEILDDQFDAEAAIAHELAALRRHVVGKLRSSDTSDLEALRATLRPDVRGL